jgi:general stress protein 26
MRSTGVVLFAFALLCSVLVCDAWGEETEASRDTLLTAARNLMEKIRFCVLITLDESGHPRSRAMDPFLPDEKMVIWMGTFRGTRKVQEIKKDPRVTLYYAHPEGAGYVSVYGTAKLVDDPELKKKWWKKEWEQFYPDKDKDFLLIAVTPKRLEVLDYSQGISGDPTTWIPPSVEF